MIAMLMFPAVYYITHPGAAYRHPLEPVILLCGAYAAVSLVEKMRLRPVAC